MFLATILWMVAKSISHHFEIIANHDVHWYLQGIIIPGFLRRCEMDFVHPQYQLQSACMGSGDLSCFLATGRGLLVE